MKPAWWRVLTLAYGIVLLALVGSDVYAGFLANGDSGFTAKATGNDLRELTVKTVTNRSAVGGALAAGDRVHLVDQSFANRVRFARERPGDQFTFARTDRDGRTSTFVDTIAAGAPVSGVSWSFDLMAVTFVLVGLVIAARRPQDELARLLVGLFLALGTVLVTGPQALMPIWLLVAVLAVHLFCQPFAAYAALALAVSFPRHSERGLRRWLERANLWLLIACVFVLYGSYWQVLVTQVRPPAPVQLAGIVLTIVYYAAVIVAFVIAGRGLAGADRKRLQWVAWTLAAGFSGEIVLLGMIAAHVTLSSWAAWLNLTLLAIPFGLGYAIVRHRVVDIGFVVNRALVFGSVSAIVVVAFMILEWALSTVFVKVSHITSTSLELGLALVLGFSLRTIHGKVDHFVDDLFFRDRHAAERALQTFAREVGYITDPHVTLERAHAELCARTGASAVSIYLVDARSAVRVDPSGAAAAAAVDVDDPALVRLRATRAPLAVRDVDSALAGEHAFPMLVREAVTGMLVLGPKSNGEAYAPDEIATIERVALALGNALDALQTAALKAEIASVLVDGAPLDALRRTVDSAAWVRGVTPQPAGLLAGLGE